MTVNRFTEHPNSVGETYWQHLRAALSYSARMLAAAGCCALHGLCPWLCGTTGSDTICDLHDEMQARRAISATEDPGKAYG
ncbi:MAG: DUF6356 family protein [Pseudomonadales bacterium]